MLQELDLAVKLKKSEYKEVLPDLELKIGELQREARLLGIPIIIIFEGWEASGKGTLINRLILPLDPRGFKVYPILKPNEDERLRPFLWRFWTKTPERGRITIFDRSWYGHVLTDKIEHKVNREECVKAYQEIDAFERQLADGGNVIIKFWLHIGKKEQQRRFEKLEADPKTAWRVTKEDWQHHRQYKKYLAAAEAMIERTNTHYAPWTVIEATHLRFATVKMLETSIRTIEDKINEVRVAGAEKTAEKRSKAVQESKVRREKSTTSLLDKVDLSKTVEPKEYDQKIDLYQKRFRDLEHEIYRRRIPVVILYEGWDAAGKGGNIKRLTANLDPRGYEVIPIGAPSDTEKAHHYLWRFWNHIPKAGHITIFDRTWYGRVLVERVEGFCRKQDWQRAYQEINELEEHLTNFGTVLVKFWLHISKEEQSRRFEEREHTAHKQWKITEDDYRNREKWDPYKAAIDEMLLKTGTTYAPWTIIESESKHYARLKALKTVIDAISQRI